MKVAIISDIHENFHNLILALNECKKQDVQCILCLGDLMNSGIAKVLSIQDVPVFMVWGNNDGEKVEIMKTVYRDHSCLKASLNVYEFLELDGRNVFLSHYDDLAIPMAKSGLYDAVFYGHNHLMKVEHVGDTVVANPGEICAQKTGISSFAIYNTDDNSVELKELSGIVTLKTEMVHQYFKDNKDRLDFRSASSFKF